MPTLIMPSSSMRGDSITPAALYDIGIICNAAPDAKRPPCGGLGKQGTALAVSALGELLAASRLVQADFLAFDLARVARDQPGLRQRRLQLRVVIDQRACNAVAHRARLPRFAAADHIDHDVEGGFVVDQLQGLAHDHAAGLPGEEFVDGLVVDDELARALLDENPGHGALAPAGAVVIGADHENAPL